MQRGITWLPILFIIAAVILGGVVGWAIWSIPELVETEKEPAAVLVTNGNSNSNTNAAANTNSAANTNTATNETADWETYTNAEYGFSFQYPVGTTVSRSTINRDSFRYENFSVRGIEEAVGSGVSVRVYNSLADLPDGARYENLETWIQGINGESYPHPKTTYLGFEAYEGSWPSASQSYVFYFEHDSRIIDIEFYWFYPDERAIDSTTGRAVFNAIEEKFLSSFELLTAAETADWETYTNATYSFSARYPSAWTLDNSSQTNCPSAPQRCFVASLADPSTTEPYGFAGVNIYTRENFSEQLRPWFEANEELTAEKIAEVVADAEAGRTDIGPGYASQEYWNQNTTISGEAAIVQYVEATEPAYIEGPAKTTKIYYFVRGARLFEIQIIAKSDSKADGVIQNGDYLVGSFDFN